MLYQRDLPLFRPGTAMRVFRERFRTIQTLLAKPGDQNQRDLFDILLCVADVWQILSESAEQPLYDSHQGQSAPLF